MTREPLFSTTKSLANSPVRTALLSEPLMVVTAPFKTEPAVDAPSITAFPLIVRLPSRLSSAAFSVPSTTIELPWRT